MIITSPDNPLVRRLKPLAARRDHCAGPDLIEGVHLLQAAQLSRPCCIRWCARGECR
jgi:hypothetical protein